ncbi:uncharacterized protein RNJ42_03283 [Nakaseomyces bracarensis]|uniref:uncharacterized protein n=1 Tax=Nakaseomyces bracarensis TaxID=273131 RepID=UPI0038714968
MERNTYVDNILVNKEPYEATESIRIRLSQAKLLNTSVYVLMKDLSNLRRGYNQHLRKIIAENEDLDAVLKNQMTQSGVLTAEEMRNFTFDSLGEFRPVWKSLMSELKSDLNANTSFQRVLEEQVIEDLKNSVERNRNWGKSKQLHSKLSKIAVSLHRNRNGEDIEHLRREWDAEIPVLFQIFELMDFERLNSIKDCLLKYQSGYTDYLLNGTNECETVMSEFLNFDPESEIQRFARDASQYNFQVNVSQTKSNTTGSSDTIRTPQMSPPTSNSGSTHSPRKQSIGSRLASSSTVLKHDIMHLHSTTSNDEESTKSTKKSQKLKSKVGSIFGRNKLKSKKSQSQLENSPSRPSVGHSHSSSSDIPSIKRKESSQSIQSRTSHKNIRDSIQNRSETQPLPVFDKNEPLPSPPVSDTASRSPAINSISQPPLKPVQKDKPLPNITPNSSPLPSGSSTLDPGNSASGVSQHRPLHIQAPKTNQTAPNQFVDLQHNIQSPPPQYSAVAKNAAPLSNNVSSSPVSKDMPPLNPTTRSSIISGNSITSSTRTSSENQQTMRMQPQLTGEILALKAQSTGSSSSKKTDQSLFQHLPDEFAKFGLNASIAEVINASFKDGVLQSSQLVGEIALNYVKNTVMNTPLPAGLELKIANSSKFNRVILNQAFMEKVGDDIFKVNPQFIDSRTLGAVKYSIDGPIVPITVHPVWKFEPHQASVVLTVKLSALVPEDSSEMVLDDFMITVNISGAETTSALSKPPGTFNKDRKRITWKFKEPLVVKRNDVTKFIGRFMTEGQASEPENGVMAKFVIREHGNSNSGTIDVLGSATSLEVQEFDVENPFGGEWQPIRTNRTLTSGNYTATA